MRRWLTDATTASRLISDRPQLWVSGGLAWAASVGPFVLLAAVVSAPAVSELSSLGARAYVSSAWPWNVVALGVVLGVLLLLALGLVALADVALLGGEGHGADGGTTVLRSFAVTLVGALPALATVAATLVALAGVARDEFISPDTSVGGPLLRTAVRVSPLLALLVIAAMLGGTYATAARVLVVRHGAGVRHALARAPRLLAAAGPSTIAQLFVTFIAWVAYMAIAIVLLRVLWDPIGLQLADGAGFGPAQGALLVGFVAIWLCLVLGGGALHAWASVSWARILSGTAGIGSAGIVGTREAPNEHRSARDAEEHDDGMSRDLLA